MSRYGAPPHALSQCGRILRVLQANTGAWVPLPDILALGVAQYNTRIKELRDNWGLQIENRTEIIAGERHSWFRLLSSTKREPDLIAESDFMRHHREEEARENPLFARGAA